jgi:hypothetical protein
VQSANKHAKNATVVNPQVGIVKKSILNPEFVEVPKIKPSSQNLYRLHPKLSNLDLN